MKATSRFVMLPWLKGLDTSTDEGIMHLLKRADYLVGASDIVFDPDGSKVKREGFAYHDLAAITDTPELKGGWDYWANLSGTKTQRIVCWDGAATSKCWFQSPTAGGAWVELAKDGTATAPTALKSVSFEVFNDDLIMAVQSTNSGGMAPLKWNNMEGLGASPTYKPLGGSPPVLKFLRKHQGRIWGAGNPLYPDRLYATSPGNHEEWNGDGDSFAIDIDPGDGDSSGITAIFPSFRGLLIVAKENALYKVEGSTPLDYKVTPMSCGLGCNSHNSCIAVDMDDIYFQSERGYHSLVLTEKYGDFEGAFLSNDVQKSFNSLDVTMSRYVQGIWIPKLNSCIWNVSESGTNMDTMWLYDLRFKAWYRWTGVKPTALIRVEDSSTKVKRAYFGNKTGRLSKTQIGTYADYTSTAISQVVKTPFIYPDNDPSTIKGMKKLGVWMKAANAVALTVSVRLAGVTEAQTLTFTSTSSGTPKLDVDFVLGVSMLDAGSVLRMTPFTVPFDGFASSVQLTFTNAVLNEKVSLFGFWIEWEPAGDSQETVGF